ncbi:protein transport protein Sec61 subunit beta [Lathyrus oleraceus]|nr:protein transport protein Sec61 subunit beta-like [Pisum sativum]
MPPHFLISICVLFVSSSLTVLYSTTSLESFFTHFPFIFQFLDSSFHYRNMAKGASQSQSSTSTASRPGGGGVVAPRGSAAATAGMRRRRVTSGNSTASVGGGSSGSNNMLRFYTDDAPGLKISPTVVLVMSLCFIGFVTALHVFGKLYRYKSGGGV